MALVSAENQRAMPISCALNHSPNVYCVTKMAMMGGVKTFGVLDIITVQLHVHLFALEPLDSAGPFDMLNESNVIFDMFII